MPYIILMAIHWWAQIGNRYAFINTNHQWKQNLIKSILCTHIWDYGRYTLKIVMIQLSYQTPKIFVNHHQIKKNDVRLQKLRHRDSRGSTGGLLPVRKMTDRLWGACTQASQKKIKMKRGKTKRHAQRQMVIYTWKGACMNIQYENTDTKKKGHKLQTRCR